MANSLYLPLETISADGSVPDSRLTDARCAYEIVNNMISANEKRSKVDSKVYGLVSGYPPYRNSKLIELAEGWRCNVNWRIAESFLNLALTAYWDVIAEAPSYASVHVESDNPDESEEWSGIASEEFDKLNRRDTALNFMFRRSHHDMVLYRCGPAMFQDAYCFKAKPIKCGNLLVPDETQSCVDEWSMFAALVDYRVDELFGYIRNPKAAESAGWDLKATRRALMEAAPKTMWPLNNRYNWEWFAQRVRNNDYYFSNICESVPCAHLLFKEFPKAGESTGRITHCIVLLGDESSNFLFRKDRRFANWQQVIHPFYYDTGDGTHHSVKGLGIKAYGSLETYNRMECHAVDAAFWSSSMHMQASDSAAMENLAVTTMGPYIWHPPGGTFIQQQMGQNMDGLIAVKEGLLGTVTSNLAQYRQNLEQKSGNPITAREVNWRAANQSVIGKSGMTWYFEQLDDFWKERYRRVMNPQLSITHADYAEAKTYRDRCAKRGVPETALRLAEVRATRTVGYGSADERLQSMERLLARIGLYDEDGRRKILEDLTRMDVGPALARRYIKPDATPSRELQEQAAEAQQNLALMKTGLEPIITPSQNPVVFCGVYLTAIGNALQAAQQGANPDEIAAFLNVAVPSTGQQLQRFTQDPSRKQVFKVMEQQWQKAAQATAKLNQMVQQRRKQMAQQQAQLQAQQSEAATQARIDEATARHKMSIQERKTQFSLADKARKSTQALAIADAVAASDITRKNAEAKANVAIKAKGKE